MFFKDYFDKDHVHEFKLKSVNVKRVFSRVCGVGADRTSSFVCVFYEKAQFRDYINKKIENNELTREKAFELISQPRSPENTELQNEKDLLIKTYVGR